MHSFQRESEGQTPPPQNETEEARTSHVTRMQEKHTWLRKLQKSFPVTLSGDDPTLKTVYLSLPEVFGFFWASRASSIPALKTAITTHPRRRNMYDCRLSLPPLRPRYGYLTSKTFSGGQSRLSPPPTLTMTN